MLGEADAIIALGALAAAELYDTAVPILATPSWRDLANGTTVLVVGSAPGGPGSVELV